MPKSTFFRLPQAKQDRLLEAAKEEFSRVPLKEASIANIVKLADIPRGSFYQYFEDKEDLYYYYFELLRKGSERDLEAAVQNASGDLLAGFETYFVKMISEILVGEHAQFYQHMFVNMDYHSSRRVAHSIDGDVSEEKRCQRKANVEKMMASIDTTKVRIKNEHELDLLFQVLMNAAFSTIAHSYRQKNGERAASVEEVTKDFQLKMDWIKHGATYGSEERRGMND